MLNKVAEAWVEATVPWDEVDRSRWERLLLEQERDQAREQLEFLGEKLLQQRARVDGVLEETHDGFTEAYARIAALERGVRRDWL